MAHAPSLERVNWIPGWDSARGRIWSIPDMVQNVVLFMPYGFFAYLGFEKIRAKGAVIGSFVTGLLGLALSLFVEVLQTMSAIRSPSATYLILLRDRLDRSLTRTVRESPGMVLMLGYLVAISVGALAPFIPTLDVGLLRHNVRLFLDDPWGSKAFGALITDGLLFSALTVLTAFELPAWLGKKRWFPLFKGEEIPSAIAAGFAIACVAALAIVLELGQLVIIGHSPGVQDMVVGIAAALLGGVVAVIVAKGGPIRPARELGELTRRAPILVVGFAILAPLCRA